MMDWCTIQKDSDTSSLLGEVLIKSSFRRMPGISAKRVERLKLGPKGERSELSIRLLFLDPGTGSSPAQAKRRDDEKRINQRFLSIMPIINLEMSCDRI